MLSDANTTYLRGGGFDAAATKAAWFDAIGESVIEGFEVVRIGADMNWAAGGVPGAGDLPSYESAIGEVFCNRARHRAVRVRSQGVPAALLGRTDAFARG